MGHEQSEPFRLRDEDLLEVGYVSGLYELLRAIDAVFTADETLCIEGTPSAQVSAFLRSRERDVNPKVERQTIWPKEEFFHLPLTGTNLSELRAIADNYAEPEVAAHLTVYRDDEVLLTAHDAGDGHVCVARSVDGEVIEQLTAALGASLRGTAYGRDRVSSSWVERLRKTFRLRS